MKKISESEKLMDDLEPIKGWEDEGGCPHPIEYNAHIYKEKKKVGQNDP